jgi:hypothetical protein
MPVDTIHPEYEARRTDWEMVRDGLEGQRVVKARRQKYLPVPPGMVGGISGEVLASTGKRTTDEPYDFYLGFAEFPEILEPALTGFQGIIHAREAMVTLPSSMEYLRDDATPEGDSLETLWGMVTREILSGSRVGLLADVSADDKIRFVGYSTENIINWQVRPARFGGGAIFVVIRELKQMPRAGEDGQDDEFATEDRRFWRELRLGSGEADNAVYMTRLWEDPEEIRQSQSQTGPLPVELSSSSSTSQSEPEVVVPWKVVNIRGRTFDFIPFVPINALDIGFEYGAIPMMPMTRRAFSIYRLTADYRRALYQKGDPQPYVAGIPKSEAPTLIGGEQVWTFSNPDAKPGYLDVDGDGIPLMRQAIQDELVRFDQEGGRLLSTTQRAESGDALKLRTQAHQVTLRNIVINAGIGMTMALRQVAKMFGLDEDSVTFKPDLDFAEPVMDGQQALHWAQAINQGAPLSLESFHGLMVRGGVTEKTFEEETELIEDESIELKSISKVPDDGSDNQDDVSDEETMEEEENLARAG